MKKLILGVLVLGIFGFVFAEEKYEITEVDIFSLKKFLTSENITVRGVSIENTLQEAMQILGKTDADLEYKDESCWLNVESGFKMSASNSTKGKLEKIKAIVIDKEFKKNLHGKTAQFFDLENFGEMVVFLKGCLGKPDSTYNDSAMGIEMGKIIYLNGFGFLRMFDREKLTIGMVLTTLEEIMKLAK